MERVGKVVPPPSLGQQMHDPMFLLLLLKLIIMIYIHLHNGCIYVCLYIL